MVQIQKLLDAKSKSAYKVRPRFCRIPRSSKSLLETPMFYDALTVAFLKTGL